MNEAIDGARRRSAGARRRRAALVQKATAGGAAAAAGGRRPVADAGGARGPERQAWRSGPVTVANRSSAPMTVTVTPRAVDCRALTARFPRTAMGRSAACHVTEGTFTLAPGQEKQVTVNLDTSAANGALRRARGRRPADRRGQAQGPGARLPRRGRDPPHARGAQAAAIKAGTIKVVQGHGRAAGQEHGQHDRRRDRQRVGQGRARHPQPDGRRPSRSCPARRSTSRSAPSSPRARRRRRSRSTRSDKTALTLTKKFTVK